MDLAAGYDIENNDLLLADNSSDSQKRRVAYYYDRIHQLLLYLYIAEISCYSYGKHHCWKVLCFCILSNIASPL